MFCKNLLSYHTVFLGFFFLFRASHLGLLYLGSLVVLLVYSILYGLTAKDAHWLGAITSAAVIILGMAVNYYINIVLGIYIPGTTIISL